MHLIKKIIFLLFLVVVLEGCYDTSSEIIEQEVTKDEVSEAINSYKESLYKLGASNNEDARLSSTLTEEDSARIHSKDELVASSMNVGYDSEWLDMAILILNLADALNSSSYTLGEEAFFYDVLNDSGIWGWKIYNNTKVILSYNDEVLYLRVIDDLLIQTFFFEYKQPLPQARAAIVENKLIKILRLYEEITPEGNSLYIEDFVENTGLSMWNSNGNYFMSSRVKSEDDGSYTIWSSNSGDKAFGIANYIIDGIPLYLAEESNEALYVEYDFKYIDVFDSFNEGGVLFLNEEVVQIPLEVNARTAYHGADTYVLTGSKELSEPTHSLGVEEVNIITDITYADIKSNIALLLSNSKLTGTYYDYSLSVDTILGDFSNQLYLDY